MKNHQHIAALDTGAPPATALQKLAGACRILAHQGHTHTLAGQMTCRDAQQRGYWTPPLGLGFEEVDESAMLLVDDEMQVLEGRGRPNPAVRFHAWIYRLRPDVQAIAHTHPPAITAFCMLGMPLPVAHMDSCMLHDDIGFLEEWPGVPVDDNEGRLISAVLGTRRTALLANHGHVSAGVSIEEAVYLAVSIEKAAEAVLKALSIGPIKPVRAELAREAHDFLLQPAIVNATYAYWLRQALSGA